MCCCCLLTVYRANRNQSCNTAQGHNYAKKSKQVIPENSFSSFEWRNSRVHRKHTQCRLSHWANWANVQGTEQNGGPSRRIWSNFFSYGPHSQPNSNEKFQFLETNTRTYGPSHDLNVYCTHHIIILPMSEVHLVRSTIRSIYYSLWRCPISWCISGPRI